MYRLFLSWPSKKWGMEPRLLPESSVHNQFLADFEGISEHGCSVWATLDGFLQLVQALRLEPDADGLFKPAVLVAPVTKSLLVKQQPGFAELAAFPGCLC